VAPFLPGRDLRILEIGCGAGATLAWLRAEGFCAWAGGVETYAPAAEQARGRLDRLWSGDIETLELNIAPGSLDAVLCLDVLEHLVDPWRVVARLGTLLRPSGAMIASIPNIRYHKVALPLLLRGRFDYAEGGVLDRTHLRFFVRDTAVALMESGGLRVDRIEPLVKLKPWRLRWLIAKATGGRLIDLMALQYLIRARRS
jgi:2-polyprenyl-3-methyl-5-hydroxy-6-metoxy-1,4-benzoquinol methylase